MTMYEHIATKHGKQAMKMIDSQYIEVTYVPPSKRKHGEEWIKVKKSRSSNSKDETQKGEQ